MRGFRIADFGLQMGRKRSLSPYLLVSLSLLLASPAHGQCATCPGGLCPVQRVPSGSRLSTVDSQLSHAAQCRITVGDGSTGSGTLVARNSTTGLVLTCSHLFDQSTASLVVTFSDGARFGARMVDRDRCHDLAALLVRRPEVEPLQVSDGDPAGPLAACGYGTDGRFRCVQGNVVGQATPVGAVYPSAVISGAVRPGDSGGGVLDVNGRLVGVVWGQRNGQTYLTCGPPLRHFLQRVLGSGGRMANQPPAPPGGSTAGSANPPAEPGAEQREPSEPLSSLVEQLAALRSDIASLRDGKQDKDQYLTADALKSYARRDEVNGDLEALAGRFASVQDRIAVVRQQIDAVAGGRVGLFEGLSLGKLVAGALGLSGPLAAAVVIAGGLAGRRLKKCQEPFLLQDGARPLRLEKVPDTFSTRIAVDSPPLPQRAVPETHYVPYEKDTFAKAYQWASEQVVRKYPGTLDVLASLDSLIKQQINAQPTEERVRG